jgi:hypothetical protein
MISTSKEVYTLKIKPELNSRQDAVLRVFQLRGDLSMREVASFLGVPEHTISGRGGELVKKGKLFRVRKQANPAGNSEWVLSTQNKLL